MKIIALYVLLALLTLAMILSVDMLSGMSLFEAFHSIRKVLTNTGILERIAMVFFISLPIIYAITIAIRNRNPPTIANSNLAQQSESFSNPVDNEQQDGDERTRGR